MSAFASEQDLIAEDVEAFLRQYETKELLRFVAVGSVDDGKSTLIGRLLHDAQGVYEDQLEAVKKATSMEGAEIDFSLFTDGLKAEREQGITIDVAYRYFNTPKRKFIIADTPGHVQYTRNMVTGASTANVGVILVDARLGVLQQSRRHAYIASLLGIPHLLVAVNKMDLESYAEKRYDAIREEFAAFLGKLRFRSVTFVPISALRGDNVVTRSPETPWYRGPTVLEHLENVPIERVLDTDSFRYPVQYVLRPHLDYRGFAAQVASGTVKPGDVVMVIPSGQRAVVKAIDTWEGEIEQAFAPMSVALRLDREVDVSRGDMLVHPTDLPRVGRTFEAHLVWMSTQPLDPQKSYVLKHTTQMVRVQVDKVHWKVDPDTLAEVSARTFELNNIGRVTLTCHRAIYYDAYEKNRTTGAFILIDSLTNNTVGAGMIIDPRREQDLDAALKEIRAGSGMTAKTQVSARERRERLGQGGATVWLTGLPGSGRWALAYLLERRLFDLGRAATVIDPSGEDLRSMISAAKAATDAGLVTICAFPSYTRAEREQVRDRIGRQRFVEVFVDTAPEICRERRPDASFEGFEPPVEADVVVSLDRMLVEKAADAILAELDRRRQFDEERDEVTDGSG